MAEAAREADPSRMSDVIEVEGLRKEYRRLLGDRVIAVDGLDLSVPVGGVFGFLGPNGSGKTTTIRCLLGLSRASAGRCRLLGADCPQGLHEVIERVGALVESPGLNPGMSGRQALRILARVGRIPKHRIDEILAQIGLEGRGDDLVKTYSLGMRQRLGLGIALLKDPEVLILDEPANGLDPAGMREIRGLIRRLGAEGRTVFLSSHLLGEVEQTCDRVAIVAKGRAVACGTIDDVLLAARPNAVWVVVADPVGGLASLARAGLVATSDGERIHVDIAPQQAETVTRVLVADGHYPSELRPVETTLEDAFFALTEDKGATP